jgi:hypothetical protein
MSAVAHIRAALSHAAFESPRIQEAVDHLMETLDRDLDRGAYEPSRATLEGVRELIKVLKKGRPRPGHNRRRRSGRGSAELIVRGGCLASNDESHNWWTGIAYARANDRRISRGPSCPPQTVKRRNNWCVTVESGWFTTMVPMVTPRSNSRAALLYRQLRQHQSGGVVRREPGRQAVPLPCGRRRRTSGTS